MKKLIVSTAAVLLLACCKNESKRTDNAHNQRIMKQTTEQAAIEKMLFSYRDALNTSDVSKVLSLYTQDGVFMPSNAPSAIGQEEVKASYEFVFKTIKLHIEFFIDEIVVNGNYAFARTTSKGTTLIHANQQTIPEENRELFVLQRSNGEWKISRYMFNKMK